jgi:adenine-specific DNA-methyltransferase
MATGLSQTKWANDIESHATTNSFEYSLTYDGKLPDSDVLRTTPANVELLFSNITGNPLYRNMLLFSENLNALSYLLYNRKLKGKIRLVYIDPPFATNQIFQSRLQKDAYIDVLTGSHYIEFLRQRLILIRELLSNDGSIYLHLDENIVFEIKLIMDEVFGKSNYRNFITRKKCNTKNYTRKVFGNISDYILFYSKSSEYVWNRPVNGWSKEDGNKEYQYIEEGTGRRYKKVPIHAPGVRNGETGKPWRGMLPPPGKHWQYIPAKLEEMDKKGEMFWSSNGNPRRKIYLDQNGGIPIQDIWLDYKDAHNQNIEITGYPTEKNYDMLQMIVNASSNPGDIVLDCFSGSGTTLAAADFLDRNWIGIDSSIEGINTTLKRFFHGTAKMGDFVSNKKVNDDTTISLFDSLETIQNLPDKVKKAIKIPAFEFYVQDIFGMHSNDLVKGYLKESPEHTHPAVSKSMKSRVTPSL